MEIVKVIITKTSKPTYWYANKVGQIFECYQRGSNTFQVVKPEFGSVCFIAVEDLIPYDYIGRKPIKRFNFL
jgi:hypothetical protein